MKRIIDFFINMLPEKEGYVDIEYYGKNCYDSNGELLDICKYDGR